MTGLLCDEEIVTICKAVSIQYRNVTDRQIEFLYHYSESALLC